MSYSESFKSALEKIGDAVKDLSELNVRTYGGDVKSEIKKGSPVNWEELIKNAKTSGTVSLKLSTDIKIDGDTDHFIADDADKIHQEAHAAAIEAGRETRKAVYEFIKNIVDKLV